jgi:hypothetical protein
MPTSLYQLLKPQWKKERENREKEKTNKLTENQLKNITLFHYRIKRDGKTMCGCSNTLPRRGYRFVETAFIFCICPVRAIPRAAPTALLPTDNLGHKQVALLWRDLQSRSSIGSLVATFADVAESYGINLRGYKPHRAVETSE